MFKKISLAFTVFCIGFSNLTFAVEKAVSTDNALSVNSAVSSTEFDFNKLKANLTRVLGMNIQEVRRSPMPNLVELITDKGLFYASTDGKFFIQGKLYGLGETVTNYSEESLTKIRLDGMEKFSDAMIVYPAKDEKYVITVFTDITCGYCRKMHEEMDSYNDKGITVRYLAYPRSGLKDAYGQYSQGFKDLRSIWCHENPQEALTKAKMGSNVAQRICDKPIEDEFYFGRQVGVSGTPAVMLENGMLLPGYRDPDAMISLLEKVKAEG